jgi:hypothetical protein
MYKIFHYVRYNLIFSPQLIGKFRHLPVVENGEVIAIVDITKCLYDAISKMEKAAEQGSAIAAAVEGSDRQRGSNASGWLTIIFSYTSYSIKIPIAFEFVNCIHMHACLFNVYTVETSTTVEF